MLGKNYVGCVPSGSDREDFIQKRWNLDVRAPFHSDLALLSSVHLSERAQLRHDGGNLGNEEAIARPMFLPQMLQSFEHHHLASLDTFRLLEGAAITRQDKDSLENTLLLHAEVKLLEAARHREDVEQEGTVIEATHLIDVKGVATDMCEDEMIWVECLVGRDQPCLEP